MSRLGGLVIISAFLSGCGGPPPQNTPLPDLGPETEGGPELSRPVPPGFGTLLQDQITLGIRQGDLLIKVTPLEEWVIRLTAPDTYARLQGMARTHGERAAGMAMSPSSSLFLVSFFSYQPNVTYQPEDLELANRGLRFRPGGIAAVTPSWGLQRLGQQETQMAVYAFAGGIDLEADLVVEYQGLRNEIWRAQIVPLLRAEAAKARARAGG